MSWTFLSCFQWLDCTFELKLERTDFFSGDKVECRAIVPYYPFVQRVLVPTPFAGPYISGLEQKSRGRGYAGDGIFDSTTWHNVRLH